MAKVELGKPRADVRPTADGLEVRIRARRRGHGSFLLLFWLFFMVMFTFSIFDQQQRHPEMHADYFAMFFPFVVLLIFFVPFIWMSLSQEVMRLSPRELAYGRQLLGIGRMREFGMPDVKDLRVVPQVSPMGFGYYSNYMNLFAQGGTLAFDYGYKTYRLGAGLEEAEAKYLVKQIGGRFPGILEKSKIA